MKTFAGVSIALGLFGLAAAHPSETRGVPTAYLNFQAAPVDFSLNVPVDGTVVTSYNDLNVNIIKSSGFDAYKQCTFTFDAETQPALSLTSDANGVQQIDVGPPSMLSSVSCTRIW